MLLKYSVITVIICIILATISIFVYKTKEDIETEILLKLGMFLYAVSMCILFINFLIYLSYSDGSKEYILERREKLIINLETIDKYSKYEDKLDIIDKVVSFNEMVTERKKKVNDKWLSCYIRRYWREDIIKPIDIDNINLEVKYNNDSE